MRMVIIFSALILLAGAASAQNYSIDWYVIASGGGHAESENYQSDGTVGQSIVGQSSSENYTVDAGYWVGLPPSGGDCVYAPGDSDEDGTARQLTDVVKMIAYYRGNDQPGYVCFCTEQNPEYKPSADPDGNCTSFELTDVVKSIAAYRGPEPLAGCVDCPGAGRLLARNGDQPLALPTLKAKAKLVPKLTAD